MGRLHMMKAVCKTKPKQCERCGSKSKLTIHHKDGNCHNYDLSNLEIICEECRLKNDANMHLTERWAFSNEVARLSSLGYLKHSEMEKGA